MLSSAATMSLYSTTPMGICFLQRTSFRKISLKLAALWIDVVASSVREILWNSLYNIQMGPSYDNCQEEIMSCVNNYHRCKRGLSMVQFINQSCALTHWGRVPHICVGKLIIIGSDNGLPPDRRQAIIWTNAGLLSIEPLRTYFSQI